MKTYNEKSGGAKHCEGYLVGIMAWFFDQVSSLNDLFEEPTTVKFGRWGGSTKKALKRLETVDPVVIVPFEEEPREEQPPPIRV